MVDVGLLAPDEPYELIDGELVYVSPQNPPHANIIGELNTLLNSAYGSEYRVRVQVPIGGIADSIPEPDLAVIRKATVTNTRHPRADETLLIVEVADASVSEAIGKGGVYSRARARCYWLVDVPRQIVVAHHEPDGEGSWRDRRELGVGETLTLPELDHVLDVGQLFALPG